MIKKIDIGNYHLRFNPSNGHMARWGRTFEDDPEMCPIGPEIADIEISTICHGVGPTMESRKPCACCYKSNSGCGENMTLVQFSKVLSKMPLSLTQIAFGIGDIDSNPDLWNIMDLCKSKGIVPNITVNGMGIDSDIARLLALKCGAVAVSHYGDDLCFNAIQKLSNAGLQQINIHAIVSAQTLTNCHHLIDKAASDSRLKNLKAIVFLLLKPKGNRNSLTPVSDLNEFSKLFEHAKDKNISIGMDSCSAPIALKTLPSSTIPSIEGCESGLFSIYINTKGEVFPCSFTEGTPGWTEGINLLDDSVSDFEKDVWYAPRIVEWRNGLLNSSKGCTGCSLKKHCRSCQVFDITICKG